MAVGDLYTIEHIDTMCPHCKAGTIKGNWVGHGVMYWCDTCGGNSPTEPPSLKMTFQDPMGNKKEWVLSPQFGRDMHSGRFVEAICEHGVGHHKGVHGCDGCCKDVPPEVWDKVSED